MTSSGKSKGKSVGKGSAKASGKSGGNGGRKIALVTGGSAGIGQSISQHLLADGYIVLNLSRRPSVVQHENLVDVPLDL